MKTKEEILEMTPGEHLDAAIIYAQATISSEANIKELLKASKEKK